MPFRREIVNSHLAIFNVRPHFRCSKFSSFNQTLDDSDQWTAFAPIAKLESLDEIDQVRNLLEINFISKVAICLIFFDSILLQDSKHSANLDKSQ